MRSICDDLAAEHGDLDAIIEALSRAEWLIETPSPGWTIRDQISHLWFFDQRAVLALTDPEAFARDMEWLLANGGTDASIEPGRSIEPDALLDRWRTDRQTLIDAAATVDPSTRVPWYGPAMAARSFITARLMETWAHGQDVADALGGCQAARRHDCATSPTSVCAPDRSATQSHGMTMPVDEVAVCLTGPAGEAWQWGDRPGDDTDGDNVVSGSALDFCLVVTQRRHLADTQLSAVGTAAVEWMAIAQAFAGGAGPGRRPGQFTAVNS